MCIFFCTIIVAVRLRLRVQTNPLFHCSDTYASLPCALLAVRITCTYATVTFFLSGTAPASELLSTFAPREVSPTCAPVHQCGCTVYSRFAAGLGIVPWHPVFSGLSVIAADC